MTDLSRTSNNPLKEPTEDVKSSQADLDKILSKWELVELLIERSGRADVVVSEMEKYISDLRSDLKILGWVRLGVVVFSLLYVVFINTLLLCLIFYHQKFFYWIGIYGRVALIIAAASSSVILLAKILMGVFKTHGERNKDEYLSPALQQAIEATKIASNTST